MKPLSRPKHKSSAGTVSKESSLGENYTSGKNRTYSDKFDQPGLKLDNSKLFGKQLPHDSAVGHVTGEALFVDDITPAKNAHADIPGENLYGPVVQDEPILVEETVQYVGQPIAIIAGESHKAIREAKKKIRLNIKELKPVFTIDDAIAAKQYIGEKRTFKQGDFEKAWRDSEHKLKGTFVCNGQEQFYLESQAALARPGEHGDIHIHSSTQNPSEIQTVVAEALGIGYHQVVCVCKRMGGGFGGRKAQGACLYTIG